MYHTIIIAGNLGRDPEMRYTPSHRAVTNFNVAASRSWKTADGERHTETEWFNVVAWGSLAEICHEYLSKGQQVYIEGRLQTRKWEDDEGNKHRALLTEPTKSIIAKDRSGKLNKPYEQPKLEQIFNKIIIEGDKNETRN